MRGFSCDIEGLFGLISYGISILVMMTHMREEKALTILSFRERKNIGSLSNQESGGFLSIPDGGLSLFKSVSAADPILSVLYCVFFGPSGRWGLAKLADPTRQLGLVKRSMDWRRGFFCIGYFIFEIPGQYHLALRFGARIWIGRIMITWGIISSLTMFVNSANTFYIFRLLLGIMEPGFFPGVILYLTYWYPAKKRAQITALFLAAVPVSGLIGGPLSGWILDSVSGLGLAGWQWLFVVEGLPSVIIGLVTLWYLDDGIAAARWLTDDEKKILQHHIDMEKKDKTLHSLKDGLLEWRVWVFGVVYFCFVAGLYGFSFWDPSMDQEYRGQERPFRRFAYYDPLRCCHRGNDIGRAAVLTGPLSVAGTRWHLVLLPVWVLRSALHTETKRGLRYRDYRRHGGNESVLTIYWSVPTAILAGTAAAGGIALTNSMGNLSGFVAPYVMGYIKDTTQSLALGLYALAALVILGSVLVVIFGPRRPKSVS